MRKLGWVVLFLCFFAFVGTGCRQEGELGEQSAIEHEERSEAPAEESTAPEAVEAANPSEENTAPEAVEAVNPSEEDTAPEAVEAVNPGEEGLTPEEGQETGEIESPDEEYPAGEEGGQIVVPEEAAPQEGEEDMEGEAPLEEKHLKYEDDMGTRAMVRGEYLLTESA